MQRAPPTSRGLAVSQVVTSEVVVVYRVEAAPSQAVRAVREHLNRAGAFFVPSGAITGFAVEPEATVVGPADVLADPAFAGVDRRTLNQSGEI